MKRIFFAILIFTLLIGGMGCEELLSSLSGDGVEAAEVEDGIFEIVNTERASIGLSTLTRSDDLDALAELYASSSFSEEAVESTDFRYLTSNSWQLDFPIGTPSFDKNTAREQVTWCLEQSNLNDAMLRDEARATGVGVAIVGSTAYFTQVFDVVHSSGGDGAPIILDEDPEAVDPTWGQLEAFLIMDGTDALGCCQSAKWDTF